MANEAIGQVACAHCGRACPVRVNKSGKRYYYCGPVAGYEGCGMVTPNLPGGQAWLAAHMRAVDAPDEAEAPADNGGQETPAQEAPAAPPARPGFFSRLLDAEL